MRLTIPTTSATARTGGMAAELELANALAARGHEVTLVHIRLDYAVFPDAPGGGWAPTLDQIPWIDFHPAIQTVDPGVVGSYPFDPGLLPDADIVWYQHPSLTPAQGLPVTHAHGRWGDAIDHALLQPNPKLCVSRALMSDLVAAGQPPHRLAHVPNGIDQDRFRVVDSVEHRDPVVAMRWEGNPTKGATTGLDALHLVKKQIPDLEVDLFNNSNAPAGLPAWCRFHPFPTRDELASVFNRAAVQLVPSRREGFGLVGVEAMACGAALVTTDNGGSREYADHGVTALVATVDDACGLADHCVTLLRDHERRSSIAESGARRAREFTWERSAALCEEFLQAYVDQPDRYR